MESAPVIGGLIALEVLSHHLTFSHLVQQLLKMKCLKAGKKNVSLRKYVEKVRDWETEPSD